MNALGGVLDYQAYDEGWFLGVEGQSIWAYSNSVFYEDLDRDDHESANRRALAFVQQKAREGSAYHIEALARTQLL